MKHLSTKNGSYHAEIEKIGEYYHVRAWLGNFHFPLVGTKVIRKKFLRKSKAITFAKKYIKKHSK